MNQPNVTVHGTNVTSGAVSEPARLSDPARPVDGFQGDSRKEAVSRPAAPFTREIVAALDEVANAGLALGRASIDLDAMVVEPDSDRGQWRDRWLQKARVYTQAADRLRDARMEMLQVVNRAMTGAR